MAMNLLPEDAQQNSDDSYSNDTPMNLLPGEERSFGSKLLPNMAAGFLQMGHGFINTPHNMVNLISPKLASYIPTQMEYDFPKMMGLLGDPTLSDKIIRGLVEGIPSFALPGAPATTVAGKATPLIGKMIHDALLQSGYWSTQTKDPREGAVSGAIGGAVGPVIGKAFNYLRPSNLFRGNLSPEDLAKNQKSAEGTNTGLGNIVESPSLNRLQENILPHVIGSGAENTMQKNSNIISQMGNDLLEKVRGNNQPGDYGIKLQNALKKASKEASQEKTEGFKALNKAADDAGLIIGRENFSAKAKDYLDEINSSPELKAETEPSLISDLERYSENKMGNNLKSSNIFRGKIGEKANDAYVNGKPYSNQVYTALRDALGNSEDANSDIGEAFSKSGNQDLKDLYTKNQIDYREKFKPFEDKDIVKFTRKGGDPDLLLPHFLRGGKNDRATILTKLTSSMPPQEAQLPLYAYLSKAVDENGNADPIKLSSLYRNLGENQKNALIKDKDIKNQLSSYSNLVGMNKNSFNLMFNPKTGARNQSNLATDLALKIAQVIGGGYAGGAKGLLATLAGGAIGGRVTNKLLTSERVRNSLIKTMLKNKEISLSGMSGIGSAITNVYNPKKKLMELEMNTAAGYQK